MGRLRGIDAFASKTVIVPKDFYGFIKAASGVSTDAAFAFSQQKQPKKCTMQKILL
jgi:hypothetical protein